MRKRVWPVYLGLMVVTVLTGLATRQFRGTELAGAASMAGDALWAVLVYLGYALLLRSARPWVPAALAGATAAAVEFGQLYHAPWIDGLRRTTLGGLILGYGFDPMDLLCYAVGITVCLGAELGLLRPGAAGKPGLE